MSDGKKMKSYSFSDIADKLFGKKKKFKREINLVPDIKAEMIKALKMRNLILFVCIVVIASSVGGVLILSGIAGGQRIAINGQENKMKLMSKKMSELNGLSDILTIQDQLKYIKETNDKKKMLSRVFDVLSVLLYQGKDKVSLSELNVDLATSTLSFDAQADAGEPPYIDYRVIEAFKKKVSLMKYDYGRYVDEKGNQIPARCMVEHDEKGNILKKNGQVYAIWKRGNEGCDIADEKENKDSEKENKEKAEDNKDGNKDKKEEPKQKKADEEIFRVPKFEEWYKDKKIDLSGRISDVAHFESSCIKYKGEKDKNEKVKWTADNNCRLAKEEVAIRDSSNGRNASGSLVARFSSKIVLNSAIFDFKNKHMLAIQPAEQNVTDSYVQVEAIFEQKAEDCLPNDKSCGKEKNN